MTNRASTTITPSRPAAPSLVRSRRRPYTPIYKAVVRRFVIAITTIDLDTELVNRARELTGSSSNRAVIDLALRQLIAFRQKDAMLRGIAALTDFPAGYGAPTIEYPVTESE